MPRLHVHVWVHVLKSGTNHIVCRCVCGRELTASQIMSMRMAAGVA